MKLLPASNMPWNYRFLAAAFLAGVVLQSLVVLVDSPEPAWPYFLIFAIFDILVLARIAIARWRRETNRSWLFYAAVSAFSAPLLLLGAFVSPPAKSLAVDMWGFIWAVVHGDVYRTPF